MSVSGAHGAASKVLSHGSLEKVADNLFRVEGTIAGPPLRRVMTIVRRTDGTLLLHSPILLEEALMAEIEALGKPTVLVVPSRYHRRDAPSFVARYPGIEVTCPSGARSQVEKVVPVSYPYEDFRADDAVHVSTIEGMGQGEGVLIVRSSDGVTLVFNDLVFNMPHLPGFQGFILKHITASSGGPKVSRIARLFMVRDASAVGRHLERLADTPTLVRIIVAHHEMITNDPAKTLRAVAATLG